MMTRNFVFLKNESQFGFSPLSYWIYDLSELGDYLQTSDYQLVRDQPDFFCLQKAGNACWTYSSKQFVSSLYKNSLLILIGASAVVLLFLFFYIKSLWNKSREQMKQRLSLQILSHEFRTPVSSMLLLTEQLGRHFGEMNSFAQDMLTHLTSEVFKLQRIIEISRTYLQTSQGKIQFRHHKIDSINDWFQEFVSVFNSKIQVEFLSIDLSLCTDVFWLKFILSNLLTNAFHHGAEPVIVRLKNKRNKLLITIEDQGVCAYKSLSHMTEPFVKRTNSQGMGLGLNMVWFVVKELGHELQFSSPPTSFTLILKTKPGMSK